MGLEEYRKKRNFKETAEPKGKAVASKKMLHFVVQKHAASHLHYDFRLEAGGVLKSWAVPKGPSMNPSDKRLAIQVEDHPFDYRNFEGMIPEGNYGAGTVMVWDEGTYIPLPSGVDVEEGLQEGRLNFIIRGHKLKGEFALVRIKNSKQWLLMKKKDNNASSDDITQNDLSVISGKTMEEIAGKRPIQPIKQHIEPIKKPVRPKKKQIISQTKSAMPKDVKPMLATLADKPFDLKDWVFEIKWDGYRALAEIKNKRIHLYSRNHKSLAARFKPIIQDLKTIEGEALLDGEIVVLDDLGRPSFQLVQNYARTHEGQLIYYVFDLLYLNGQDLQSLPLIQRKALLKDFLPELPRIKYCDHIEEKGVAFFEVARKSGLEGIIAKNGKSIYQQNRSRDWLKIKSRMRQEAIICGFTKPKGTREKFGALILGVYEEGKLTYAGLTGNGFNKKQLSEINKPSFYQKDLDNPPEGIQTARIKHEERDVDYLVINDENGLFYAINLGCIELHPFHSRLASLKYPDYLILDLDPEDVKQSEIVKVAQAVHKVLQELEIEGYCKTSGGRGLHIYTQASSK